MKWYIAVGASKRSRHNGNSVNCALQGMRVLGLQKVAEIAGAIRMAFANGHASIDLTYVPIFKGNPQIVSAETLKPYLDFL